MYVSYDIDLYIDLEIGPYKSLSQKVLNVICRQMVLSHYTLFISLRISWQPGLAMVLY